MTTLRIGHLSDIHVPQMSAFSFRDLFNKRITGWLNFRLHRAKEYRLEVLDAAIERLIDAKVDLVMISGDISNLAFHGEYALARAHLSALDRAGIPWRVIPGNHDRYLSTSDDGAFETIFADAIGEPLREGSAWPWIEERPELTLIGLNSALPTPPFAAWGRCGPDQLRALEGARERIQARGKPLVIAVHHHIGKAPNRKKDGNRNLRDSDELVTLAQRLGACLLLHGHNHWLHLQELDGLRVFGASCGISSRRGIYRGAGQVAIHTVAADAPPTHEVAFWMGDHFSEWMEITPESEIADAAPALPR